MLHRIYPSLLGILLLAGCASMAGSNREYAYRVTQGPICQTVASTTMAYGWEPLHTGYSLAEVLDAVDDHFARSPSPSATTAARQVRYGVKTLYANPQWTYARAMVGVEQACRRATMN